MKKVIIIGAGPAGLTAAYELLKTKKYIPIVLEQSDSIGGLSKNIYWGDNIIDPGGHRFFSKDKKINDIWNELMPLQSKPSSEELITKRITELNSTGLDPEKVDNVRLMRTRLSRIYFCNKFFDYPLRINIKNIKNLGFIRTIKSGNSYIKAKIIKRNENSLEDFYINRFGKYLYTTFFKDYTEKVWGKSAKEIDASWGRQRVKGLSLLKALTQSFSKVSKKDQSCVEGSLVTKYSYPKLGPGSFFELMANYIKKNGGIVNLNSKIIKINKTNNSIDNIVLSNGKVIKGHIYISSMPLKDLINCFGKKTISKDLYDIANNLEYRSLVSINLLLSDLNVHNKTKFRTINNRIPDTWIYIQDKNVKLGRVQILNNWSPYLCKDNINKTMIGLEYFCDENDDFWCSDNNKLINLSIEEANKVGILNKENVLKSTIARISKAYPAYFGSYKNINKLIEYLNNIDNLYCIGRNGQHRYNNMDHSMLTAIECVNLINHKKTDKKLIWKINTKQEFLED